MRRAPNGPTPLNGGGIGGVDQVWANARGIGMRGWVLSPATSEEAISVTVDGIRAHQLTWFDRPDIAAAFPEHPCSHPAGFLAYFERTTSYDLSILVDAQGRALETRVPCVPAPLDLPESHARSDGLYVQFIEMVNHRGGSILEVGSRIVSPGSVSKRDLYPGVSEYVGFDYYPDANTDVVGDAHRLSDFLPRRFDAVVSSSVLEHLAMPWVFAAEVNKVLEVGGLTFHGTHQTWPVHEAPWDFWRFTDEALKVLFSPALGFEVIAAGMDYPMRVHPDQPVPGHEIMPEHVAFGGAAILARKVADVDVDRFNWKVATSEVTSGSQYPKPDRTV